MTNSAFPQEPNSTSSPVRAVPKAAFESAPSRFIDLAAEEAQADELRTAFTEAPVGMALLDVSGRVLHANRVLCEMTRATRGELVGGSFDELFDPDDVRLDLIQRQRLLADQIRSYRIEMRCSDATGSGIWAGISATAVRDGDRSLRYLVVSVEDISERKREEELLQHLANCDDLTGLFNRRRFEDELTRRVTMSDRYRECSALLLIDLDQFKPINDQYGHDAGDHVLREVAAAIDERLRDTDLSARLGGDEFAVLIPHTHADRIRIVARDLVGAIGARQIRYRHATLRVTASIGVAMLTSHSAANAQEVLARADAAMYRAKRAGGNSWSLAPSGGA